MTTPPPPHTHTPPPPPTLPSFNMANAVMMHVFKGHGSEDPEQVWLVAKAIWKAQKINDLDMKKDQLVKTLQDKALSCYIRYNTTNPATLLVDTNKELNAEFKKPKSLSRCITEIKEIKQAVNEPAWEVD